MESFLQDDEEEKISQLSELELDELITTKFVETREDGKGKIEVARAVGSPMELDIFPGEDILLEDYACLSRPIGEINLDNAVMLLNRIQNSSEADLNKVKLWDVFERSKKSKNTTRLTEVALIDYIISSDHRPSFLHIFCRRLIESDIPNTLQKALVESKPPTKYRSLFRVTVKTEMPLKQFIGQLDKLWSSSPAIQLQDVYVTALKKNFDGTHQKLRTPDVRWFADMEHKIAKAGAHPMVASARFVFGVVDKPFVCVQADYHNELDSSGRRCKTIVIEQFVNPIVPIDRRVTFGEPLVETIHNFEIDDDLPFHNLKFKIFDLNQFMEQIDPISYKNVTLR
ncbi:hypothetical protein GCK72_014908 [Caenorhabditis remanei]|uniref:Uncharacterized protein n=1 Tax=Caenorhabditis remanei TaxID=31234 RepID=A0A6A5GSP4_CAERE|nr:hypothetical protein GCK72_014908 [Caenorhabditis remanei]KAF1758450.1 hypothetical protein GCK72_014908 [Caenorhabditis remanei]